MCIEEVTETDFAEAGFDQIRDVPLFLRAELDRRKISVRELLDLEEGSVVLLSRPAGENVDVFASDVLIGNGEILVRDGALAIRLSDIASDLLEGNE